MIRLGFLAILVASSLMIVGCASDAPQKSDSGRVSTIPWNQPQAWEGEGPMGGMMGTP